MKKSLIIAGVIVAAALAFASYAGSTCCVIRQDGAASQSRSAAGSKVVTLDIEGMSCGSCEIAVRRVLTKVSGVESVKVSFKNKNAVITYDTKKVTPEALAHTVGEKLPGYKAKVAR